MCGAEPGLVVVADVEVPVDDVALVVAAVCYYGSPRFVVNSIIVMDCSPLFGRRF